MFVVIALVVKNLLKEYFKINGYDFNEDEEDFERGIKTLDPAERYANAVELVEALSALDVLHDRAADVCRWL